MSLNNTPSGERVHIGFFGRRNAGKSSLVNAVLNQNLAIVSDIKGTTTDPVYKAMELLPIGPVMIIDTPGIDDEGDLGQMRVRASYKALNKTDIAVLVVDRDRLSDDDEKLLVKIREKSIPYIIAYNKCDSFSGEKPLKPNEIFVSAKHGTNINELRNLIASVYKTDGADKHIVADLIKPGDIVLLVVPIDKAAPKGRLILPQQQTIRDILDCGAISVVCKESELKTTLLSLGKPPALVITDSQVFGKVSEIVPENVPLTSFSILMARYKGLLCQAVEGVNMIDSLKANDKILISEGCSHHRQCGDIGTVKIPAWMKEYTGKNFDYTFTSGTEFPEDLGEYRLIIHCGGCMLNEREMKYRLRTAREQKVPMTNYGILIAKIHGILERSIAPLENHY